MTKSKILASDMPPVEKVWLIAKERSDIGKGMFGVVADTAIYERFGERCCPIGAVLVHEERERCYTYTAASLLNVSEHWIDSFTDGFDGVARAPKHDIEGYDAGREIRRRFIERGVELA